MLQTPKRIAETIISINKYNVPRFVDDDRIMFPGESLGTWLLDRNMRERFVTVLRGNDKVNRLNVNFTSNVSNLNRTYPQLIEDYELMKAREAPRIETRKN